MPEGRFGTAEQAAAIHGVSGATVRNWLARGWIRAVRVGGGPYMYDLDSVEAMRIEHPCRDLDARIAELAENAPEFTARQVNQLRLLLRAGGAV